jgi:hypothetical protein
MSDIIRKRGAKFIKQLEKQLNEKGYELVSYEFGSRKKHGTVTVKNPETQEIVESTFSPKSTPRAVKNIVSQISGMFKGRKRRGQGEFKLSLDGPQKEKWFRVLKGKKMSQRSKDVIQMVMRDGQERTITQIIEDATTYVKRHPVKHTLRDIPTNRELSSHFRNNPDYQNMGGNPTMYRRV